MMIGAQKHGEALIHAGFRCAKFEIIKVKELNILNAMYGINQGSSSNNVVSVDGVVNISGTQVAVDSNYKITLNLT